MYDRKRRGTKTENFEVILLVFLFIMAIPVLQAALPLMDLDFRFEDPLNLNFPYHANNGTTMWEFNGTHNNTRTDTLILRRVSTVETQAQFNKGNFNGTTASRRCFSDVLGIGYLNGTASDRLKGYWRLDCPVAGSGGVLEDYSGNGNDGTTANGVLTQEPGTFSTGAAKFSGNQSRITVPNSPSLNSFNDRLTVEAWVQHEVVENGRTIVTKPGTFRLSIKDDNEPRCTLNGGAVQIDPELNGGADFQPSEWYHIACVYDGTGVRMYVDGEQLTQQVAGFDSPLNNNGNPVYIGDSAAIGGTDDVNAWVDEVRIFDRSFLPVQMKEHYLFGEPFRGDYTQADLTEPEMWSFTEMQVESNIRTGTSLNMTVQSLDVNDNVLASNEFRISDGLNNYSLTLTEADDVRVIFDGDSNSEERSWGVNSTKLFYQRNVGTNALVIENLSKNVFGNNTASGFFTSDNFIADLNENDQLEKRFEIEGFDYSATKVVDTRVELLVERSDDNFTTIEDTQTFVLNDTDGNTQSVSISPVTPYEDLRFTAYLTSNTSETPSLVTLEFTGNLVTERFFPSKDFRIDQLVTLIVVVVVLLFIIVYLIQD